MFSLALDKFSMKFVMEPQVTYDAGVAVDDVGFVDCQHKTAEDSCPDGFFHCTTSKVSMLSMDLDSSFADNVLMLGMCGIGQDL